jgi:hypothetical protein
MMNTRLLHTRLVPLLAAPLLLTLLLLPAESAAQSGGTALQWMNDPAAAVELARRTRRPIMAYVVGSSRDRDSNIERDQRRTFSDPAVVRASSRFVPLRMSRSQHRELLSDFGFTPSANMEISFVRVAEGKGERIDGVAASGLTNTETFLQKMDLVWKEHRRRMYESDVRPILENSQSKPAELKAALQIVREFQILEADRALIALVGRDKLDPAIAGDAYHALAALSTKAGVERLVALSESDPRAAKALEDCTPEGAEHIVGLLQADAANFPVAAYRAACKIGGVRSVKEARWWERANPKMKQDEVERVREVVGRAAERWRRMSGGS